MKEAISEIVGDAVLADKTACVAYRALRPLECSTCGAAIAEGTLFTRRSLPHMALRIWPQCQRCAPLELKPAVVAAAVEASPEQEQRPPARSALLHSLLTTKDASPRPSPPTPPTSSTDDSPTPAKRTTEQEVERRLGPALRRARRSRP